MNNESLHSHQIKLRALVDAHDYTALTRYFEEAEVSWWASNDDLHPYTELILVGSLFDCSIGPEYERRSHFLHDWAIAQPNSYYPWLVLGRYCLGRAEDIRGSGGAQQVSQVQWLGAALACELAAKALLRAIAQHDRPVLAGIILMQLTLHFGEPQWLTDLFTGGPGSSIINRYRTDPENLEQAVRQLKLYGLKPLEEERVLGQLPGNLPARQAHELEYPADYWLHLLRSWRPNSLDVLWPYAYYLRPRWGGEPGDIEAFASGPLCRDLSEEQRNALRWIGEWDELEDFPEPSDTRDALASRERFEHWLQRDLRPYDRGVALGWYANFCHYTLQDKTKALEMHIESVRAFPSDWYFGAVDGPFRDFTNLMIYGRHEDSTGCFKQAVERLVAFDNHPTPLTVAALGHAYGRWGFAADPRRAQWLLDRVATMRHLPFHNRDTFAPIAVSKMLWEVGDYEHGYFLAHELAQRRVPNSSGHIYDLLSKAARDGHPAQYVADRAVIEHWQQLDADEGSPIARYNVAWRRYSRGEVDHKDRASLEQTIELLMGALDEAAVADRAILLIGSLWLEYGRAEEKSRARWEILPRIINAGESWVAGRACGEIAIAYQDGNGVPKNIYAAHEWADRAILLGPRDEYVMAVHSGVKKVKSKTGILASMLGWSDRNKVTAKDLPPPRADK
ncbi:DUF4034 domain-containing protein [Burkholderia ubonensis]|uniref:DUF4034 domain-containing protein n=1 Tax=Burkholderia ubonensis TaxID=101571 RepID=UPI0007C6AB48|nr:DUF4034 domain-containing protein [Burkholderia ubonensis]